MSGIKSYTTNPEDLDPKVRSSLEKLGISADQLLSTEDRAYKFLVKYCREHGELPTPSQIATGAGKTSSSITRVMLNLIDRGLVAKIGLGQYVPIVED